MKALIVEVSQTQRLIFANILSDLHMEVEFSDSGKETLALTTQAHFDLICISVVLPDMQGYELCGKLRHQAETRETPLLVLCSGASDSAAQCLKAGATEVFYKNSLASFEEYTQKLINSIEHRKLQSGQILYVEDSRAQCDLVTRFLESHGYTVNPFDNAEDAFEAYRQVSYDLLMTDVILKGRMTGLGLVRAIRDECNDQRLPILVMSGFDDKTRTAELYRAGANDYVNKPPQFDELYARVSNLVNSKQLFDQLQRRNNELTQLAILDELTGLYNRRFITHMAEKKVAEAQANNTPLALAVLDIDHFKQINDRHGHPVGDQVLKLVSDQLASVCNTNTVAARIGGEEFVRLTTGMDLEQVELASEQLRDSISRLTPCGIDITISIGIASLQPGNNYATLFKHADQALYQAKQSGRNRVCQFDRIDI
ncbi:diguanylate cyclase [Porticoccaceae bacterium LTM1]|nr:diguanylate cyclase [Porticoccaceae bacterium LTM1]